MSNSKWHSPGSLPALLLPLMRKSQHFSDGVDDSIGGRIVWINNSGVIDKDAATIVLEIDVYLGSFQGCQAIAIVQIPSQQQLANDVIQKSFL